VTDYRVDINLIRNPKHIWNGGTEWNVPVYKHLSKDAFVTQRDMSNFYALRLLSVAINVLNLWYMFRVARLFLHEPEWTPCPVLLVVTLPQFLFMSAAIENDDLAYLLATLTIYYALQILESPESVRNFLAVGLSLGLGLLTKKTLLFTVPVVALIVAYAAYNHRPAPGRVLRYGLLLFGLAMLISSFFFIRNYHLYGEFLGTRMEKNTLNELLEEKSLLSPYFWSYFPRELFFSYVGLFGYMNAPLPKAAYMGYALFIALCGIGLCLYLVQRARQGRKGLPEERLHNVRLAFAFLFILACFSGIVLYNLTYSMPQGRFLFPVISLITVLLTLGLKTIVVRIRPAWGRLALAAFIAVGLFALDVLSLAVLYRFYYVAAQYGA
jgi:4-amino-4-deoxy-L-arabinose transferase-like glycosyltransferase